MESAERVDAELADAVPAAEAPEYASGHYHRPETIRPGAGLLAPLRHDHAGVFRLGHQRRRPCHRR